MIYPKGTQVMSNFHCFMQTTSAFIHFIFKRSGNLEKTINLYLKEIVIWLNQWKLKMSAHKCQHIIFTQNKKLNLELDLLLDGKKIPLETYPVFLGITFDKYLTFNKHFSNLIK